jgi:hypothetical protein
VVNTVIINMPRVLLFIALALRSIKLLIVLREELHGNRKGRKACGRKIGRGENSY